MGFVMPLVAAAGAMGGGAAAAGGMSAAMGIASAGMSLVGGITQAVQQRKAAKANAAAYAESAAQERNKAALDASDLDRQRRQFQSRQVVQASAQGADVSSGSALDIAFDSAATIEGDELRLLQGGQRRSDTLRKQGKEAGRAGYAQATGSLLTGFGQAFQQGGQAVDWYQQRLSTAT